LLYQGQVELDHIRRRKGISASESGAAPTSSRATPTGSPGPVGQGEQPGRVVGQRPFGEFDDQTDAPLPQGGEQPRRRLDPADRSGFDVDEQSERCSEAGVQRLLQRLARPVQLVDPAGPAGSLEQHVGQLQHAAGGTASERLERSPVLKLTTG